MNKNIQIIEDELPIKKHSVRKCENCGNVRHVRKVEALSAFGGANRGFYNMCFFCCAPVLRWKDGRLKDSRVWETPYQREKYISELEAAEQSLHSDAGESADLQAVSNASAESTSQAVA